VSSIRFGIIGSGYMGRTHAEAIRRLSNAQLIALSGGSRAPALATDYEAEFHKDVDDLIQRDDIDAIVVTTPHHLHYEQTVSALKRNKHVLVEKPLATSVEDCHHMITLAQENKLILGVGYHQRFRVNNYQARALISDGVIGDVVAVQVSMPTYAGAMKVGGFGGDWNWWNDPASLGHILNSAPHAVDLLRWFMDAEVVTVSALSRTFLPDVPVEDTTMALLEFSNGAICSLFSSRALPAPAFIGEEYRFRITGKTGLLDLDPYGELRISDENGWRVISQQPSVGHEGANSAFGDIRMKAYSDQIASFIDLINGKPGNIGVGNDGKAGVQACLAMLESSATKNWISIRSGDERI
jgi:UDP-N-acetyl-2-amino-2-deoxyglucuronate dehydrogenase